VERVRFPRIRELVRVGTRVTVKGASMRVVAGDVRVEGGGEGLGGGGARAFALGCAGRGVGRLVTLVGGTRARVGAYTGGGEAADTLCDRSRREPLNEEGLLSRAELVVRVATMDWMVPNWVVMVSS